MSLHIWIPRKISYKFDISLDHIEKQFLGCMTLTLDLDLWKGSFFQGRPIWTIYSANWRSFKSASDGENDFWDVDRFQCQILGSSSLNGLKMWFLTFLEYRFYLDRINWDKHLAYPFYLHQNVPFHDPSWEFTPTIHTSAFPRSQSRSKVIKLR